MSRNFKIIAVFIATLITLYGCSSIKKEKTTTAKPPHLTTSVLINKMTKAVDPEGRLNNIDTLQCEILYTNVNKRDGTRTEYKYALCESNAPKIVDFQEKEIISRGYKKFETIYKILIKNQKTTIDVVRDGELLGSDYTEDSVINKYKEMALAFKDRLFFGLYKDAVSKEIANKIFSVDGNKCYRISVILKHRFFDDNSDNIIVYADCSTFLIRKIVGEHSKVFDIEYKDIDGIMLPKKYKILMEHPFGDDYGDVFFVKLIQFELNKKMDTSKYIEPECIKHNI